ncbi:MAG: hypothetical protein K9M57_11670 [Phycisphaerae bacterium]|nr:hypothetical protein [Phycisphaerae bacterium]
MMLKISENPPVLYPEQCFDQDHEGQWFVAHTKSRNEKALAWNLQKWEIPYFLPLREQVSRRKGRVLKSLLPIFSGYVFFCADEEQRYRALTTNRIAQVINVIDQDKFVREIATVFQAIASGSPIDPHPRLQTGERCRVVAGIMMGAEGIVIRKKNLTRILLEVEILGQAAAVEIDADLLEPIE